MTPIMTLQTIRLLWSCPICGQDHEGDHPFEEWQMERVASKCPYCGMELTADDAEVA